MAEAAYPAHLIDANSLCSCCASAWALSLSPLFASSTNFFMSCSAVCHDATHTNAISS